LDRLFEKKNGGGAKGRKEGKSRRCEFYPEGCIYAILQIYGRIYALQIYQSYRKSPIINVGGTDEKI